nr:ELM2 domain-containing protein [Tanacetum cinerariifolium]
SEPSSSEDEKPLKKKTKGKGKGPRLPIGGISLYDLPERREDDEFVLRWLSQFAPKKKKRIFATNIAEKLLVCSTRVDFMFKVNFLMLFANFMGKADTMRAFVNLLVVRRVREDTNIAGLDWCDFIHRCLAISHEPNTYLEIEDEAFRKLNIYEEWSENETVEAEGFCENSSVLPHTDKKGHEASVKTKPAAVKAKDSAKMPKPVENVKELAEKRKEPAEKAQEAPQYVKPKPAAVKTKEAAEKPMSAENVKELVEKPKEPAGDDYQVVHATTVMKAEDREEFKVETFTQWIEGNIDWVGE